MQELEKILEEINEASFPLELLGEGDTRFITVSLVEDIIRKHMNDGWIPADERLPEIGEYVLGTNEYGEVLVYHYGWNSTHTRKMFFQLCGAAVNVAAWYPLPKPYSLERNP